MRMLHRRHLLPFLLLLSLSSCRNAQFAFMANPTRPAAADSQPAFAKVITRLAPPATDRRPAGTSVPSRETVVRNSINKKEKSRTSKVLGGRNARQWLPTRLKMPADTLPRQAGRPWQLKRPKPSTGWGKVGYFFGRLLAWAVYLALVGLAGWLVFLTVEMILTFEVAAVILGIGLFMLAFLLLYFTAFIGFFTLVSEVPM